MKVIQIFPGNVWGGAEQYVLDLGKALASRGHDVSYIARDAEAVTSRLRKDGVTFATLPFRWAMDRASVSGLAEMMKDADIVHIHDMMFAPTAVLARRRSGSGARIVMNRHDAHRTPANIFYRHLIRGVDRIVFVSDLARRSWCGANSWFPAEKCSVILNSTPLMENISVESLREKYAIAPTTPLLMFLGRIKKTKGCDVLVKALSLIRDRDFAMVFIGACRKESFMKRLLAIARQGGIDDRIHYYGFSGHGRHFLAQADVAIAPSAGKEACPLSNIEAMQAGVCVITTTNGGQAEYISDSRNGLLVAPSDPRALADAIVRVLDNPDFRRQLAAAGHDYFLANMTYDKFVDKITETYSGEK